MSAPPRLAPGSALLIDTGALPDYPIPRDLRLHSHFFLTLQFNRWLNSSLHLKGSYEVQGVAIALYCLAQNQTPVGTLPHDDEMIARLLRLDLAKWRDLCRATVSPMHGWELCQCEGEVRWMHHVVLELLEDVLSRREARTLSAQMRAREKRIERMVAAFRQMRAPEALLQDRPALEAIEDYLSETCRGNRTAAVYLGALRWAGASGVLNGGQAKTRD